jgi:hypothetical protein
VATILKTDGTTQQLTLPKSASAQLKALQGAVGGYCEKIYTDHQQREVLLGNEDGLMMNLPQNQQATLKLREMAGTNQTVVLVGDIVLVSFQELGMR